VSLRAQGQNARHRQPAGMADAEPPSCHPKRRGGLRGTAGEPDFRRSTGRAVDYHICERDARAEARAERLEHRLLGGEPPCQTLDPIGPIADLIKFGLHETARNQWVARIFDPAPHLGDVDQINAVSDDVHKTRLSLSPTFQSAPNIRERG
jgi:hypothetical protein